jgi:hypothetical protein
MMFHLTRYARALKLGTFFVLSVLLVWLLLGYDKENTRDAAQYLKRISTSEDVVRTLRQEAPRLARDDTPYSVEVIAKAFQTRMIGIDECHQLMHLVGHEAYYKYGNDFESALAANQGRLCLSGYTHGIEAQAATSRDLEQIFTFCKLLKERGLNDGPCYHGVGHSAFEYTKNVRDSLLFCDSLAGGPEQDLTNCYRGIFSEVGNAMNGDDANSSTAITPLADRSQYIDPQKPFLVCDMLEKTYQDSCYSQVTKVLYKSNDKISSINSCLRASPKQRIQRMCAQIMAGVSARNILDAGTITDLAKFVTSVPRSLQNSALIGVYDGLEGHRLSGGEYPPMSGFCSLLPTDLLQECEVIAAIPH